MSVAVTSRRAFIAAASAATLQVGDSIVGAAQAQEGKEDGGANPDFLRVLRSRFDLQTSEGFGQFFRQIWNTRLLLSLASVERAVEEELESLLEAAIRSLRKEFPERIPEAAIDQLIVNAVRLQNAALGLATDTKTGFVRVQRGLLERASSALCPLYPFC